MIMLTQENAKKNKNRLTQSLKSDMVCHLVAGWSSLVARRAHNPKVGGSNPPPATKKIQGLAFMQVPFFIVRNKSIIFLIQ